MRLRNIKGSEEAIAASEYVIHNLEQCAGSWHEIFGNSQPLHIEIGMGKGRFLMAMAKEHPQINYVGIERYSSVLIRALDKRKEEELNNLYFICMNAEMLEQVFAPGEVDRIYLNFSDPWPKDRHAKRRLTSVPFFHRYNTVLKPEGTVEFKTDNLDLFQFSLDSAVQAGWHLEACTHDLHHNEAMMQGNIMTEYEEKFSSKGNPICKLIAGR